MRTRRFILASIGIGLFGAWLTAGCGNGQKAVNKAEIVNYNALRQGVVDRVNNGALAPDKSGMLELPDELRAASSDGLILVSQRDGQLLVGFNLTFGKSPRMEYLVYAKTTLPSDAPNVTVGQATLMVTSKIDAHWYQASLGAQ